LKRFLFILTALGLLVILVVLLRVPILRAAGNYLVRVDVPVKSDAIVVLSGSPLERGRRAAELYKEGLAPVVITTGSALSAPLQIYSDEYVSDAQLTASVLIKAGTDSAAIRVLQEGTSTWEEGRAILGYALAQGYRELLVVSSLHHTRRVSGVFKKRFAKEGISVRVVAAQPLAYNPQKWWDYEPGLLFVNNEYIKLLYYAWKYD
jgi:uncharacterized SAM-binding protein YcdF (DUF218 family)